MGVAVLVGIVLAVVAAIYPATRAAKMAPVDAMRSEA
jgi:ABC-type lipoprotein release transport system permease subunit